MEVHNKPEVWQVAFLHVEKMKKYWLLIMIYCNPFISLHSVG